MSPPSTSGRDLGTTPRGLTGRAALGTRLVLAVAGHEHGATAKQLARDTGLPLPTTYHLLRTLTQSGRLRRDKGVFTLGEAHGSGLLDDVAALADGEPDDNRERVLAHLATCAQCREEAGAQRRVKSIIETDRPLPPPSQSLLARLQGVSDPHREGDDRKVEGPAHPGGHGRADERAAEAVRALDTGADTVFGGLDQLFRALGPPPADHQASHPAHRNGEGGQS